MRNVLLYDMIIDLTAFLYSDLICLKSIAHDYVLYSYSVLEDNFFSSICDSVFLFDNHIVLSCK